LNATESNGAFHLITKPTKVTDNSSTVIDHIITNDVVHKLHPSVILSDLTDHYPIMCIIDLSINLRQLILLTMHQRIEMEKNLTQKHSVTNWTKNYVKWS